MIATNLRTKRSHICPPKMSQPENLSTRKQVAEISWIAAVLLTGLAGLSGCGPSNEYQASPPPVVTVAQPVEREVAEYAETTGTTAASEMVDLQSRVDGYLSEIRFEDGASVEQGELLFVIEKAPYEAALDVAQAQVQKAEAALEIAKLNRQRAERLYERNAVSEEEIQQSRADEAVAEAEVGTARAELKQAELDLTYTEIRTPFAGRIGRNMVDVGNLVQAKETLLATLECVSPIYAYFYVTEYDYFRLQNTAGESEGDEGVRLILKTVDTSGPPNEGRLDFQAPRVESSTGTIQWRGVFPNTDGKLIPGLFVRIGAVVGSPQPRLLIDEVAIQTDQRGDYVLVLADDDTVERRSVTLGILDGKLRVIGEGLDRSDWVVVNGMQRARPGAVVNPQRSSLDPTKLATKKGGPSGSEPAAGDQTASQRSSSGSGGAVGR